MIKMIFKTIFILSLCIGITLPANAGNIDVSDGSAFITKSELSYQLNNLSNRMTQLENSLDSKIDTLVSSYLTRNGIWNGAKQQIGISGSLTVTYGYKRGDKKRWQGLIWVIPTSGQAYLNTSNNDVGTVVPYADSDTYELIDSTTKAGMLVINTSVNNYRQSSTTRCCYSFTTTTTQSANGDHFAFIYTQDFIFWINGTKEGGRTHAEYIGTAAPTALRCPQVKSGTIIFFVDKGDQITLEDRHELVNGVGNAYSGGLAWYSYNDNSYSTYDYVVEEANVY